MTKNQEIIDKAFSINFINSDGIAYSMRIAEVPVIEMAVDHSYQRVTGKNVLKLTQKWDLSKCDALKVSYRDDKFYVIDGQHRLVVALQKGIISLPCVIYTGLSQEDEAKLFVEQRDCVKNVSEIDKDKGNVLRNEHVDSLIERILNKYGLCIGKFDDSYEDKIVISGICYLRKTARVYGENGITFIIDVINESGWKNEPFGYQAKTVKLLSGVYKDLYANCNGKLNELNKNRNKVSETMAKYTYDELVGLTLKKYGKTTPANIQKYFMSLIIC